MSDFFNPRIDRCRAIFRPVRAPAPAHRIGVQPVRLKVQQGELGGGRSVIAGQGLIPDVIDHRVGNAQHGDKIVNATVLRQSSTHWLTLRLESADGNVQFSVRITSEYLGAASEVGGRRNQTLCTLIQLRPAQLAGRRRMNGRRNFAI